jgi:hypothetical protein
MREVVLDIEADGLLPTVKQIWVVCLRNIETQQVDALRHKHELVEYLMEYKPTKIIMHNGIGYDLPALFKVWDIDYTVGQQDTIMGQPTEFIDTMHLSQFLYPDRLNGHSLEAFGELLGYPKDTLHRLHQVHERDGRLLHSRHTGYTRNLQVSNGRS